MDETTFDYEKPTQDGAIFDLEMEDEELVRLIKKPIADAKAYWNDPKGKYNLDNVRKKNDNYWRGIQGGDWADWVEDTPYIDNRIFISLETIVSAVTSRNAEPECLPSQETITSIQLAKDVEKALTGYADRYHLAQRVFRPAVRNLLLDRVGIVKQRWDESIGKYGGEIITESVMPEDIMVDKNAKLYENPLWIAQKLSHTVEELTIKFPDKKEFIYKILGITKGVRSQLAKVETILEVWFTYYKDGEPKEAVCWMMRDQILGKMKNPNWNYKSGSKEQQANYLDNPVKPYFPMNYINRGNSWIDQTTATEQAIPIQDNLNKRGQQVITNADQTAGGQIFNSRMIDKSDVAKLTGESREKVMVDGDVRQATTRIAPPVLPSYVLEDKYDARTEVDNIFATQSVSRGEETGNQTLGQDKLLAQQSMGRQEDIVRAVDDCAQRVYAHTLQMMKVYYTEEHMFVVNGEDGKFDFVMMKSDRIEDGTEVRTGTGSMLPLDRAAMQERALELAKISMIDPLSLNEDLGVPNPNKRVERLLKWKQEEIAPGVYGKSIESEKFNRQAFMDMQILMANKMPKMRNEISEEYLEYLTRFMTTGDFRALKEDVKQKFIDFMTMAHEQARQTLMAMETQLPSQEEMVAGNEQAVVEAEQQSALMGADPQIQQAMQPKPAMQQAASVETPVT